MSKDKVKANSQLRKARLDKNAWTMQELADRTGLSAQTIRKAERGLRISEASQAKIAKALGIKKETIFPEE